MQYTIESRPLTNGTTRGPLIEAKQTRIEAANPDDAITEYLRQAHLELVSLTRPLTGRESIATVKNDDFVFLVRVYCD